MQSKRSTLGMRKIACGALSFAILSVASTAIVAQEPLNPEDVKAKIAAAWKARDARTKSVSITYRRTSLQGNSADQDDDPGTSLIVLGEGDRLRHEKYRFIGESVRESITYDGVVGMSCLVPTRISGLKFGYIGPLSQRALSPLELQLAMLIFQPQSRFSVDEGLFELNPGLHTIADRNCVSVRSQFLLGSPNFFLDVDRDFLPVRIEFTNGTFETMRSDFEYERQGDDWAIRKWSTTTFDLNGVTRASWQFDVEQCTINPPVDDDDFRLTFSPGTQVDDSIGRRRYVIDDEGDWTPATGRNGPSPSDLAWPQTPWAFGVFSLVLGISALFAYRRTQRV